MQLTQLSCIPVLGGEWTTHFISSSSRNPVKMTIKEDTRKQKRRNLKAVLKEENTKNC